MEARQQGLIVTSQGRNLDVSNGMILLRLILRDGGYVQEFHAVDAKGETRLVLSSIHRDLITSSEHRVCASPMIAGARQHLFGVCRESLRMVYSEVGLSRPDESRVIVRMSGSVQGHELVTRITIEAGSRVIHVEAEDTLPGDRPVIEYLMSSYAFLPDGRTFAAGEEPDLTWAPNIRSADDAVIGDLAFFSPAAVVQHGRIAAALIPDLDLLKRNRPMPASLDLDLCNGLLFTPLLSYGFCDYEPAAGGSQFMHDITCSRRLDTNRLTYGFHLIIDADCKRKSAHRHVARFLWSKYPSALRTGTAASQHSALRIPHSALSPDARAAYGLWSEGTGTDRPDLIREAKAMREMILSAPQQDGLFPTRFDTGIGFWRGCNSAHEAACYSTVECSTQLYWLLRLHSDFEPDARILAYARRYADHLIGDRLRSGAIPCWYGADLTPISALRSAAPTAASALFLAELAKITGLKKHLQACEFSSRFVLDEIVPKGLFLDHTCLTSPERDPHTGMRPQSTRAMLWVARLCMELHSLLGEKSYLEQGLGVLDLLCLTQSVGEKPWMRTSPGMLSGGNARPQADAELTADFALCAMRYGALTGTREYLERGAAALKAASGAEVDDLTRARVAAAIAMARADFGAVYVSLTGRWSVELDGYRVERLDSHGSRAAIDLRCVDPRNGPGRLVFGGLKGDIYELTINGSSSSYTRRELESGLPLGSQ